MCIETIVESIFTNVLDDDPPSSRASLPNYVKVLRLAGGRAAPQSFIESRTFFTCCENSCMMTVSSPMISGKWGLSTR